MPLASSWRTTWRPGTSSQWALATGLPCTDQLSVRDWGWVLPTLRGTRLGGILGFGALMLPLVGAVMRTSLTVEASGVVFSEFLKSFGSVDQVFPVWVAIELIANWACGSVHLCLLARPCSVPGSSRPFERGLRARKSVCPRLRPEPSVTQVTRPPTLPTGRGADWGPRTSGAATHLRGSIVVRQMTDKPHLLH